MTIEKRADSGEHDVRELVKIADREEVVICYELENVLGKSALAIIATGPRADKLRTVAMELSGG